MKFILVIISNLIAISSFAQNCDSRIPIDDVASSSSSQHYLISESGSYYLTDTINVSTKNYAIRINADYVSLDLNGFAIIGTDNVSDGIYINVYSSNIIIKNGTIKGFESDGIHAESCSQLIVKNLNLENNGYRGLRSQNNSIVTTVKL